MKASMGLGDPSRVKREAGAGGRPRGRNAQSSGRTGVSIGPPVARSDGRPQNVPVSKASDQSKGRAFMAQSTKTNSLLLSRTRQALARPCLRAQSDTSDNSPVDGTR